MAETNDRARAGLLAKTALSVTLTVAMAFGSIPTPALSKMAEQSGLAADAGASTPEHVDDRYRLELLEAIGQRNDDSCHVSLPFCRSRPCWAIRLK